jgi:hypothetical protein
MGRKRWFFDKVNQITIEDLKIYRKTEIQIVDLRGASEYNAGHIKDRCIFVGTLPSNLDKVSKDKKSSNPLSGEVIELLWLFFVSYKWI